MITLRERILQSARFLVVGIAGTALYAALAFGLKWTGMPVFWAHAIASAVSLVASYYGQKIFTFQISGDHARRGPRFIIATGILVTVQSGMVFLMDGLGLDPNITLTASTLFYPPSSYLIHTFWTFRKSRPVELANATAPDT